MSLNSTEQDYLDFALAALPRWIRDDDEHLRGCAKLFGAVRVQTDYWFGNSLIGTATGAISSEPDWLREHARGRGTDRQNGESDQALRNRLRNVPEALIRASILAAADAILAASSIVGSCTMVELPHDSAITGTYTADADTALGGEFTAGSGTDMIFTPAQPFAAVPYRDTTVPGLIRTHAITIGSATHAGNDGTFAITGIVGNGAKFTNAAGVVGVDAAADWTIARKDNEGNVRTGFAKAFASRGYRAGALRPLVVLILPYGSTSSTEVSVREMLRTKKAAGMGILVERRISP